MILLSLLDEGVEIRDGASIAFLTPLSKGGGEISVVI